MMKQWMVYETTDDYVKEEYDCHDLKVFYNREDHVVVFTAKGQPAFRRNEVIEMFKDILKTLEKDD